jgi:SAM-dependent methyltransferase
MNNLNDERRNRDAQAPRYEQFIQPYQHVAEWRTYWQIIRQWPGLTIADIGCGTGRFARRMAAEGRNVVGIDFSEASLRVQKEIDPTSTSAVGDVRHLPLATGKFDSVLCTQVLEHQRTPADAQKLFDEIARILRPHGRALISTYAYSVFDLLLGRKLSPPGELFPFVRYSREEMRTMARRAGMRVCGTKNIIVLTRRGFDRLTRALPVTAVVILDALLSTAGAAVLWGALTVMETEKSEDASADFSSR